jgi:outer membrane lipoprotein LolB
VSCGRRYTAELWLLSATAALLSACASLPGATGELGAPIAGKLSVKVESDPPRNVSAAFELRGTPSIGQLDLTNPLGSVMARAHWEPGEVLLSTPDTKALYSDMDSLTRDVLGESVPVAALFDWLRGRPWPDAPSEPLANEAGFQQLGWNVSLVRYDDGWITARRSEPPVVTVRARIEK